MMIRSQLSAIEKQGEQYKGVIVLGSEHSVPTIPLYNDIKKMQVSRWLYCQRIV